MTKYKFEIQSCIDVVIEGDNREDARTKLIDNIKEYAYSMVDDPYVSNGEECNK